MGSVNSRRKFTFQNESSNLVAGSDCGYQLMLLYQLILIYQLILLYQLILIYQLILRLNSLPGCN